MLVEHNAVQIKSAQRIRVVGAEQSHLRAARIVHAKLALMDARSGVPAGRNGGAHFATAPIRSISSSVKYK